MGNQPVPLEEMSNCRFLKELGLATLEIIPGYGAIQGALNDNADRMTIGGDIEKVRGGLTALYHITAFVYLYGKGVDYLITHIDKII